MRLSIHHVQHSLFVFVSACLILFASVGGAQAKDAPEQPQVVVVQANGTAVIDAKGDGRAELVLAFPPEVYKNIKADKQDPKRFLREFASHRNDSEYEDTSVSFDDAQSAIVLRLTQKGGVRNLGDGRWMIPMDEGVTFGNISEKDGRIAVSMREKGQWAPQLHYDGGVTYLLPPGAQDARYDAGRRRLTWTLPRSEGEGSARLETELRVKQRLMAAIYKVYGLGASFGNQWVAKMIFRNSGRSVLKNLKVRFRVGGYSEWGLWQKFKEVVPGQTAVAVYYPVLEEKIAGLSSNTPADVRVEWEYTDKDGKLHTDTGGERIVILGVREFVFSDIQKHEHFGTWHESFNNSPLLAAWVSRDDDAVKQFASMANKNAGGLGAGTSVRATVTILKAIYELMRKNNITYQHPPALPDYSVSFDVQQVQNVKFPRDVIRDRSGTCIDLAILYAAAASNLGIPSFLAVVPGHCFPIFRLPNGRFVGVEATGVGGGLKYGSASFDQMLAVGMKEMDHWENDGRYFLVDVRELWTQGVSNPELPELPADIMQRWGITTGEKVTPTDIPEGRSIAPGLSPDDPNARRQEPGHGTAQSGIEGIYMGQVTEQSPGGGTYTYPMAVAVQRSAQGGFEVAMRVIAQVPLQNGQKAEVRIDQEFRASMHGNTLIGKGTKKTLKVNGQAKESALDDIELKLEGQVVVGRFGSGNSVTSFRLARQAGTTPDNGGGSQPQPPASPFVGSWKGQGNEKGSNGETVTYPVHIQVEAAGQGQFRVGLVADIQIPSNQGQTMTVRIQQMGSAHLQGNMLVVRFQKKTISAGGQTHERTPDAGQFTIQNGRLVARVGTANMDPNTWSAIQAERQTR